MTRLKVVWLLILALCCLGGSPAQAYSAKELSQLVAPVALYPDALLTNILVAATYPDEVKLAADWNRDYGPTTPTSVDQVLASVNWDPAIKSLTAFPDVLNYMAANLTWTRALGNALLTQPNDLDAAIQELRLAAQQDGALQSNDQVAVSDVGGDVVIGSANPDYLSLPAYDPAQVYYGAGSPLVYGPAIFVGRYMWFGAWDWHYHTLYFGRGYNYYYRGTLPASDPRYLRILEDVSNRSGEWHFNPAHRRGRPVPSLSQPAPALNLPHMGPLVTLPNPGRPVAPAPALTPERPAGVGVPVPASPAPALFNTHPATSGASVPTPPLGHPVTTSRPAPPAPKPTPTPHTTPHPSSDHSP